MGVEIDRGTQDAILRGPIVVQREYSNGHRVIVSRLDEGDAISLGDFDRFDVSADGQWMLGHRGVSQVVIARTDGSSRIEMSGTAKFTGDGRRIVFKNAQVGVSGPIELIDLDAGTRTPIASGVGDFTSLADGRVVYLAGGDVHMYAATLK
jgi:hypothetical protein